MKPNENKANSNTNYISHDALSSYSIENHQIYPYSAKTINNREELLSTSLTPSIYLYSKNDCIPHVNLNAYLLITIS